MPRAAHWVRVNSRGTDGERSGPHVSLPPVLPPVARRLQRACQSPVGSSWVCLWEKRASFTKQILTQ